MLIQREFAEKKDVATGEAASETVPLACVENVLWKVAVLLLVRDVHFCNLI